MSVSDHNLPVGQNTTSYEYDAVGNLAVVSLPNSIKTNYNYNNVNQLASVVSNKGTTTLADYRYTLGASGQRLKVTELNGRTVTYAYDNIYRLVSETVSSVTTTGSTPNNGNGNVNYNYDAVGNRVARQSTIAAVTNETTINYDNNDRLVADSYDNNGNTIESQGRKYHYDSENRLVAVTTEGLKIDLLYDGDGQRVAKTVNGITTKYLIDTNNFTGYAQVVEELVNDEVQRQYSYGLDLISERQVIGNQATNTEREVSFYGYDGHGSVRYLSDLSGKVTDTYTYDAYGILLEQTGSTPNLYHYAGEQWDADLGLYYNRARYLDVERGRFWTSDSFEGEIEEPLSLHKYLYSNANPVGNVDPSGNATLVSQVFTQLGYLSTAYSAFGFLRNPSIETASVLALDLAIPGLARGIKTLRDSGRVFAALQKAKFVNDNEVNSFKTLSEFGYKLLMTEKALQIINNGLSNGGKLLEGIFANTSGKLSLVEAKTTLSIFHINESIEKSVQVVKRLEDVVASGAPSGVSTSGSISSLVDEIIITYNKIGKLTVGSSSYTLGQGEKILDGGLTVKEVFVEGKRVVVNISGKEVPVYVKQVL